jgi:Tol biopolymer transport system component
LCLALAGGSTFAAPPDPSPGYELTVSLQDGSMHRVDLSNGERRPVGTIRGSQLAWSSDGQTVAYRTGELGALAVASAPFASGRVIHSPAGPYGERPYPTWAPVGRRLAFVCRPGIARHAICIGDIGGKKNTLVSFGESEHVDGLAWSPTGRHIALSFFDGTGTINDVKFRSRIRLLNVATGRLRDLTNPRHGPRELPRWGPDGSLFISSCGARRNINVVRPGATRQRILMRIPHGCAYQLDVSPNGRLIAFAAGRGVWTANADGSGLRRIAAEVPSISGLRFRRLPG